MGFIIKTAYLIGTLIIGGKLYIWFGGFKGVSELNIEQVNEDRPEEERLEAEDVKGVNKFGLAVFVVFSTLIWAIIGLTMGRIASEITYHKVFSWLMYVLVYFIFLRLPLAVLSRMLIEYYEIEKMPEKAMFVIVSLACYILGISSYEAIPFLFKWHLYFLE